MISVEDGGKVVVFDIEGKCSCYEYFVSMMYSTYALFLELSGQTSCHKLVDLQSNLCKQPLKIDKTKIFGTNGSSMKVESIAECRKVVQNRNLKHDLQSENALLLVIFQNYGLPESCLSANTAMSDQILPGNSVRAIVFGV